MPELLPAMISDFTGGTNYRDAPIGLADNDSLLMRNMYPLAGGPAIGRGGQVAFNATPIDANPIKSLYRFYKQDNTARFLATSGVNVYQADLVNGTWAALGSGPYQNGRFSFTTWSAKDKVYWINGFQSLTSYDGVNVPSTVGGSPPVGTAVEFHQDRLWILLDNQVAFSDLGTDDTWQSLARLNIADKKGGRGSFLKSANDVLIAGKTSGLFRFQGSPINGGTLVQYSEIPSVAPAAAVTIRSPSQDGQSLPVGVTFLSGDGVYYTNGFDVQRISPKIDRSIFNTPFVNAVAGFYPRLQQYWISFNPAGSANNMMWVATKLDGVNGPIIAWSEYTGFNVDSFCAWDGASDNSEFYAGSSLGGTVARIDAGKQDFGSDYECRVISRNVDFGRPDLTKSIRWLKTVFTSQKPVSYLLNYFDQTQASSSVEHPGGTTAFWDVAQWDVDVWGQSQFLDSRTSTINSGLGRFASVLLSNIGDGPDFRIDKIMLEALVKKSGVYDLFTLNQFP